MKLAVGTQVTPVVRLARPLGGGGMGAVWIADHLTLRTEVVVKVMADALASDPVSLARFSREASAAAAVKSPHVVQMLDHGFTDDGSPFIVMELLEGEDLKHRMARDPRLPLTELAHILTQTCKALGRAHAAGIVHRDIKPDNIFLCRTDDGEPFVKLLDFGIAKSGTPTDFHMTQTGAVVGTPYYMSPEQAVGSPPVDAQTDLWSLGVVAFEAMTGVRPFDGPTLGALTMAICSERPPAPTACDPHLPLALDGWMAQACSRDKTRRFSTAKAMADAFTVAIRGSIDPERAIQFAATGISAPPPPMDHEAGKEDPRAVLGKRRSNPPGPSRPPPAAPRLPGLATTTSPVSHTPTPLAATPPPPVTAAAPVPSLAARAGAPVDVPAGRSFIVAAGVGLMALGVAFGVFFAQREDPGPAMAQPAVGLDPMPRGVAEPPVASVAASSTARAPLPAPPPALPPLKALTPPVPPLPPVIHPPRIVAPSSPASSSPAASSPASSSPASSSPASTRAPSSCEPPYYFDAAHNKVFKKECL